MARQTVLQTIPIKDNFVTHWWKSIGHAEASKAWNKDNINKLEDEEHFVIDPEIDDLIPYHRSEHCYQV